MISKNQIKFIKSLELKKNRKREGLFVAEGPKVVGDLLRAGFIPHSIFATEPYLKDEFRSGTIVTDEELRKLSFLQHPQGVLGIFQIPTASSVQPSTLSPQPSTLSPQPSTLSPQPSTLSPQPSALSLALDGIQDPGNLGTIIRIADWFGIDTIYCSPDTADCYNPKVVQATMGSLAHIRIIYTNLINLLSHADVPVYGTLLDGKNIYEQKLSREGIIVMGNEGNGISQEVRPLITHKLLIPNFHEGAETAESLNVGIATAITCSEFRRR